MQDHPKDNRGGRRYTEAEPPDPKQEGRRGGRWGHRVNPTPGLHLGCTVYKVRLSQSPHPPSVPTMRAVPLTLLGWPRAWLLPGETVMPHRPNFPGASDDSLFLGPRNRGTKGKPTPWGGRMGVHGWGGVTRPIW